jgi:hypothetical protein
MNNPTPEDIIKAREAIDQMILLIEEIGIEAPPVTIDEKLKPHLARWKAARDGLLQPAQVDVEEIGRQWIKTWNDRRNPDLTHEDLDKFGAFLEWLNKQGYLSRGLIAQGCEWLPLKEEQRDAIVAQIAALQGEIVQWKKICGYENTTMCLANKADISALKDKITRLRAAVDGMAETLKWYGNEENHFDTDCDYRGGSSIVSDERGQKARDCLTQHADVITQQEKK